MRCCDYILFIQLGDEGTQKAHLELLSLDYTLTSFTFCCFDSQLDNHLWWKCPADKIEFNPIFTLFTWISFISFRNKNFWEPLPHQFNSDSRRKDKSRLCSDNSTFQPTAWETSDPLSLGLCCSLEEHSRFPAICSGPNCHDRGN